MSGVTVDNLRLLLRRACVEGDVQAARSIIERPDYDVTYRYPPAQDTVLHICLGLDHTEETDEIIRIILRTNIKVVFVENKDGRTPLELAHECRHTHPTVRQTFIEQHGYILQLITESYPACIDSWLNILSDNRVSVDAESTHGCTPLYLAAMTGSTSAVKTLISHGADVNHVVYPNYTRRYEHGLSALHAAVRVPHLDIVRMLLEAGAQVDALDEQNQTLLHHICQFKGAEGRYFAAAMLLLQYGCKVNLNDSIQRSTFTILLSSGPAFSFRLIFLLISGGMKTSHFSNARSIRMFETDLFGMKEKAQVVVHYMCESGYRFGYLESIQTDATKAVLDLVNDITERAETPLSLKRQAANVLRLAMHPNALFGLKRLALPPGFDAEFITLNFSGLLEQLQK